MKRMKKNMRRIVVVLLAMFCCLAAYFGYAVAAYGNRWFSSAYNPRIQQAKQSTIPGRILDRQGEVLADADSAGNRSYAKDSATRKAFAHVIGDSQSFVSSGVETFHAGELLGFNQGLISRIGQLLLEDGRRGNDVQLTIDAGLQRYIAKEFPSGKDGAVALINYKTGEILGLYSSPSFEVEDVRQLASQGGSSLVNRATQGQYAPGSIFKTVTLAAALEKLAGIEDQTFYCEGTREMGALPLIDNDEKGHGDITLTGAYNISCNLTFAGIGLELGQTELRKTAEAFGFNTNFLFQDLMVYTSRFPIETMEQSKLGWTAVGQGDLLVTPLHMAMIAAAIGNDGMMMEPMLIQSVQTSGGPDRTLSPKVYRQSLSPSIAEKMQGYMRGCVTDGTGKRASFSGGTVCGKTGTAQTASSGQGILPHAWFMGFNHDDEHPYAIAVIVEHSGAGSTNAAPLAGKVLKKAVELLD